MNLKNIHWLLAAAFVLAFIPAANAAPEEIPIKDFARHDEFKQVRISPTGKYLAVAAPDGEQTGIAILDISDYPNLKLSTTHKFNPFEHVSQIYWANDDRVLFSTARQQGTLNQPQPTGRIYAMNADGSNRMLVFGTTKASAVFRIPRLLSLLPEDPENILLATYAHDRERPFVEKINIYHDRKNIVETSPLDNGSIHVDNKNRARFALSVDDEMKRRIAYREPGNDEWMEQDIDWDEDLEPVGFNADNDKILVRINTSESMGLYELDPVSLKRSPLLTNETVEIESLITELGGERIVGAVFEDGIPENYFLDESERTAKLYRMLEKAFPNAKVTVTSTTRDGRIAILQVENDRLPSDFFMFDTKELKADFLLSARSWLDPKKLAHSKPISFEASDGKTLHGYLTTPRGKDASKLPMVVLVHGGPHGPRDSWLFQHEVQLFANRGYAVLQVNFRGSGGYGYDFKEAGYRKWGTRIQDDVADGVKWAINQGIADPERLCVYGGSFGGYSVAQQLVRYPDLYQCGFAVAGIYDMELMFEEGDIPQTDQGQSFLRMVLGTDEETWTEMSPARNADKIKTPLYVAHGEEDIRAHVEHYYMFIEALEEAGIPHEKLLIENEGHGFYKIDNRVRFYNEVIDFIDEHIGD